MSNSTVKVVPFEKKDSVTEHGGGGGGGISPITNIFIKRVTNGWIITSMSHDLGEEVSDNYEGVDLTEVFDTDGSDDGDKQAILAIIESMGLENQIKLR